MTLFENSVSFLVLISIRKINRILNRNKKWIEALTQQLKELIETVIDFEDLYHRNVLLFDFEKYKNSRSKSSLE